MSRFRIFGRTPAAESPRAPGRPGGPASGPPPGWGAPLPGARTRPRSDAAGPATRAARPANGRSHVDDPPTDPHGFPPIAPTPPPPWPPPPAPARLASRPSPPPAPHPAEAGALAGAFAVDYLSWDQDDPDRRGRVLQDYLPAPGNDPARLGWSGQGRQRADFALPGLVRPDGEGRVLVDVRVRVTPYRAVGEHGTENGEPEPGIAGVPAAAPAPTGRGWRSLASYWVRISVPVALEGGRLVVDAWEETLGEDPDPTPPTGPADPDDHTLADDDPLLEPHPVAPHGGGGW